MNTTFAQPSTVSLDSLRGAPSVPALRQGTFDLDFYHAMQARDEALIADEILHGTISGSYTYSISQSGKAPIEGISVLGARQLAYENGGIKSEILGSIAKRGPQLVFTSYPHDGHPFSVTVSSLIELKDDPDFYTVYMRTTDIKKGNTVPIEVTEMRYELKSDKSGYYERRHIEKIAQSKGHRNGVLALVSQEVVEAFKKKSLEARKNLDLTESVLDTRRNAITAYAIRKGIPINREKLMTMAMSQIEGIAKSANEDGLEAFTRALAVLGISRVTDIPDSTAPAGQAAAPAASAPKRTLRPKPAASAGNEPPPADPNDPGPQDDRAGQGTPPQQTSAAGAPAQTEPQPEPEKSKPSAPAGNLFGADDFGNME
jgi:hypothetical protein